MHPSISSHSLSAAVAGGALIKRSPLVDVGMFGTPLARSESVEEDDRVLAILAQHIQSGETAILFLIKS